MSVRLFIRSNSTNFREILYLCIFSKNLSRTCKFHWNPTRITGTLHEDLHTFVIISRCILLRMGNVSYRIVQKIKPIFLLNNFSRKSYLYGIMWSKYGRTKQTTDNNMKLCMHFACSIAKTADTHTQRICNTDCFSTTAVVTRTRPNVTLGVPCLNCSLFHRYRWDNLPHPASHSKATGSFLPRGEG